MSFDLGIKQGEVINNSTLTDIFLCSPQGGMRRSKRTNTLVIVADHVKSLYEDKWIDGFLHYTGMGKTGDQSLDYMQNKTLAKSQTNGIEVHLFEVFVVTKYIYQGRVELADAPYPEMQHDVDRKLRKVWIFPLRLVEGSQSPLADKVLKQKSVNKVKKARKLSLMKYVNWAKQLLKNMVK